MTKRKNIVLIGLDDAFSFWRFRDAFGAKLQTPNLDRICARSTTFTSAYCQIAICGPSRASMMSGLSPYETGVFDNYTSVFDVLRPEQFWQYRIKQAGYYCSTAGKIHHMFKPLPPKDHDVLYSHPAVKVHFGPAKNTPSVNFGGYGNGIGTTEKQANQQYYDCRSANHAIRFIRGYDKPEPFYREVGFHHPHLPFRTPIRFKEMYNLEEFIQPDDWKRGFDLEEFAGRYMPKNINTAEVDYWRKSIRNYFSAFSHVDFHIGRVWKALQQSDHAKNTIFALFSDHGYHMGDKGRFRKFTLWEEAARVPIIIHDPEAKAQVVDDPVSLLDVGPTLLDYAGCEPMQHSPGKSLRGMVHGERDSQRAVPTFWYGSASMRKEEYRITLYQDGTSELYNVLDDQWLTKNIAKSDPKFESIRSELIDVCGKYGVRIVEQEVPAKCAASYYSLLGSNNPLNSAPTNGVVSLGDLTDYAKTPGYRKQLINVKNQADVSLQPGFQMLEYAADSSDETKKITLRGNLEDNIFRFNAGHMRFEAEIHPGPGKNTIWSSHDQLNILGTDGDDSVRAGLSNDQITLGRGDNHVECTSGDNIVFGGLGNDTIVTGSGSDTIHTGLGHNEIHVEGNRARIVVDGGSNEIHVNGTITDIQFHATEQLQNIYDFDGGIIDISALPNCVDHTIAKFVDGVEISAGYELLRFHNTSIEIIEECLKTSV